MAIAVKHPRLTTKHIAALRGAHDFVASYTHGDRADDVAIAAWLDAT